MIVINLDTSSFFAICTSVMCMIYAIRHIVKMVKTRESRKAPYIAFPLIVIVMVVYTYYYVGIIFGFTSPSVEGVQLVRPIGGVFRFAVTLLMIEYDRVVDFIERWRINDHANVQ